MNDFIVIEKFIIKPVDSIFVTTMFGKFLVYFVLLGILHHNIGSKLINKKTKRLNKSDKHQQECEPNKIYRNAFGTTCVCTKDGRWPNRSCIAMMSISNKNIPKCKPNHYVIVDCNVCRCSSKGVLDLNRCTHNDCKIKSRRSTSTNVLGKCDANNWYSFAPCQFCYCVRENELVCTSEVPDADTLLLGSYNFTACGANVMKDALQLLARNSLQHKNLRGTEVEKKENITDAYERVINEQNLNFSLPTTNKKYSVNNILRNSKDDEKIDTENFGYDAENNSEDDKQITIKLSLRNKVEDSEDKTINENTMPKRTHNKRYSEIKRGDSFNISLEMNSKQKSSEVREIVREIRKTLKKQLPDVIDTVFNRNLRDTRRSNPVTIKKSNCVLGERSIVNCNTCFCLKNGKMLCTDKKCS